MKACEHPEYNSQSPESFNWHLLDSRLLSQLANDLTAQINKESSQSPSNRINMAGLRFALARIASIGSL